MPPVVPLIPEPLCECMVEWAPTTPISGHPGISCTGEFRKFWWPILSRDIRKIVSLCLIPLQRIQAKCWGSFTLHPHLGRVTIAYHPDGSHKGGVLSWGLSTESLSPLLFPHSLVSPTHRIVGTCSAFLSLLTHT